MKGHTLPGINQRSETKNMADGKSKSSAFQKNGEDEKSKSKDEALRQWEAKWGADFKIESKKLREGDKTANLELISAARTALQEIMKGD